MSFDAYPLVSLRDAGIRLIDCVHQTPPAQDEGVPYITIPNLQEGRVNIEGARMITREDMLSWNIKCDITPGDVILSRRCNPGVTAVVPSGFEGSLGQNLVLLRSSGDILDQTFFRWAVRSPQWWNEVDRYINVGAVFDSLRCADIPKFEIPLPPLEDQKVIANILGTIDHKIELNRKTNETLEDIAKALFKSWFVDFDPVRAKAEGRPTRLPDDISELFPDSFEDSELGEIPSGWKVSSIAGIANVEMGQSPSGESCSMDPVGPPLLNGPTEFGEFCPTPVQYTSDPKRHCQSGDLLFCVRGSTTGRMNWSDQSYAIGRGLAAITSSGMDHILMTRVLIENSLPDLLAKATGSTFPSVSRKDIESISVFIPTPSVRHLYKEICSSAYQRMALCFKEVSTLIQIRDALLPRLVSGELRVPDAEKMLEEVGI